MTRPVRIGQLGKHLGLAKAEVRALEEQGLPSRPHGSGRRFDLDEVRAWLVARSTVVLADGGAPSAVLPDVHADTGRTSAAGGAS